MPSKKQDALTLLDRVIEQTSADFRKFAKKPGDFTRNRKLDAATAIKVTLNMQGNSLNAGLLEAFPDVNERMTASAYEQAKGKLSPEVFNHIFSEYNKTASHKLLDDRYRVFAIDGSSFTTPYNPKSDFVMKASGRPRLNGMESKPFCQIHANILYDLMGRTYEGCVLQPKPKANERDAAIELLNAIPTDTAHIVIMDRGYAGFNMIETCNRLENCFYVIRTKVGAGGIKEIAALPDMEFDREMTFRVTTSGQYYLTHKDEAWHLITHHDKQYKPVLSKNTENRRWDFGKFCNVKCRVVKFRINNADTGKEEWEVLLTNLDRFAFPIKRMKELYHMRWDIETSFREMKYALGGLHFHSRKDEFIKMELLAHLIMFNAVSRSIGAVKVSQVGHKHPYAVDFKMAALVVRKYFYPHCKRPPREMDTEILSYLNPVREGRANKRNVQPKSAVWFTYRVA